MRQPDHPIVAGLPAEWLVLLGHNRLLPKAGADVITSVGRDPLLVDWEYGRGRTVAFASDCGPHSAPPAASEWDGSKPFWRQVIAWVAGPAAAPAAG